MPRPPIRRAGMALTAAALALVTVQAGAAQNVLSAFAGSVEKGVYEADYDALEYPVEIAADPEVARVEGALLSRVLTKPRDKSTLEVFRSYEREIASAGFTTHVSSGPGLPLQQTIRKVYMRSGAPLNARAYRNTDGRVGRSDLDRIATQPDYYLVASRTRGSHTLYVCVLISTNQDLYMVEELTVAAMEEGTVSLDLERMRSEIAETGKIAIYDIHFATGSAAIEPESAAALAVIATYLSDAPGDFYVVGHTDDTGTLEGNLRLSAERAAAVREALVRDHGVSASRLETRGVGPLAPVSTNTGEAGRALNRRVEIVQRLGGSR
ncbi:MAG: OmpA family protein [Gemmatimonadota bacterium]